MPRLMSVALTEDAVRERRKTVTRRLGWKFLKPGDRLTLCRKVMGRKPGEPLVRICDVEVVAVRREPLVDITDADVEREGFAVDPQARPGRSALDWAQWFSKQMGCDLYDEVTRVEWRYLDGEPQE